MKPAIAAVAVALLFAPTLALAVFKCKDKDGNSVYSDLPCSIDKQSVKIDGMAMDQPGAPRPRQQPRANAAMARFLEPNPQLQGPPEALPLLVIYRLWIDAEKLAGATARIALSPAVARLQELRRQAEGSNVLPCVQSVKDALTNLISGSAEAHLKFMLKSEVESLIYSMSDRPRLLAEFERELTLSRCVP